jgi:hypothetical protein
MFVNYKLKSWKKLEQIEGGGMMEIPLAYRGELSYHHSVTVGRAYE